MDTDDIWKELMGENFHSMNKIMEKLLSNIEMGNFRTIGYTGYRDSDDKRHVKEFGNPNSSAATSEPFSDVTCEGNIVRAVFEIPGISKEDINLEGTKNALTISADSSKKRFEKTVSLPCDVDPDSAVAEYNNGILEVTLNSTEDRTSKKKIEIS